MLAPVVRNRWYKSALSPLLAHSSKYHHHHHYHHHHPPLPIPFPTFRTMSSSSSNNSKNNMHPKSASETKDGIFFGPYEVTSQVFLATPHSFALVNLKPLLPGHVLVCPRTPHRRLTALAPNELTDLWTTVQRVQRLLAYHYFGLAARQRIAESDIENGGSFNLALQDGPESGQTVPHVHVHVIPRIRGSTAKSVETPSDELYERMAGEDGNVGGALWDRGELDRKMAEVVSLKGERPKAGGSFPSIEDAQRQARTMGEMEEEAGVYRRALRDLEGIKEEEEEEDS